MEQAKQTLKEKIKSESPLSGITVPLLIIVLSVVIVAGVSKMLSHDKGYVTLVDELRDKTFGNRWVAAFELSKYLSSSHIPKEDIPWLEEQLLDIYLKGESDPRTQKFLTLTAGSLKGEKSLALLEKAFQSTDNDILFSALTSLSQWENVPSTFNWQPIINIASTQENVHSKNDEALQHTALVVLTKHLRSEVIPLLRDNLSNSNSKNIQDVSAIALIYFNEWDGIERINELMNLPYDSSDKAKPNQSLFVEANKLNIIQAIQSLVKKNIKVPEKMVALLSNVEKNDSNIQVKTRAKEILLMLQR